MTNFLLIGDALKRNAYKYSVKTALREGARVVTYGELNQRVNRLANGLLAAGFCQGAAAALLVGNRIEHFEILFALAKIGVIAIPLDVKWRALEIGSTLSSLDPAAVFLDPACETEFAAAQKNHRLDRIRPFVVGAKSFEALLENSSSDEPKAEVAEDDPI